MPKVKKRSSLEDGKEAMPQLRNVHHFVARLFRFVCKSNSQTRPHNLYLNKGKNKARQISKTKVAKPKYVGGIETEAKPLGIPRNASGQAHSCLPMIYIVRKASKPWQRK